MQDALVQALRQGRALIVISDKVIANTEALALVDDGFSWAEIRFPKSEMERLLRWLDMYHWQLMVSQKGPNAISNRCLWLGPDYRQHSTQTP